ncbi:PREDICTED: uncharacterized protein LOC105144986 [Acromyrmex echinatior]|uniref:uncharacterized protein LOC105144986 n=1 Tax=Acromyrmex echinatior TaxID=103372 RepID=UPI0005810051|nr:PREDICTED: uncharacterized protein LOC105144986 [Acromyrmex echinatior]
MSRKKVWNSIMRRKKKNHLELNSKDENSPSGNVSPLLRVSTLPRRGSQHRHTLDPELSSLREHDNNHLFVEYPYKLAKHTRFLQDLTQIRTTEVDRARGNWQRRAMNAAFTGLRKRGGEAAVRNAAENAKQ